MNLSNYYVIFNDETTALLLNYIRNNIYSKYPYKSMSRSELLNDINIHKDKEDGYITGGNGVKAMPYTKSITYKVYLKDTCIGTVNSFEATLYRQKDKEYLNDRLIQSRKFK